VTLTIDHTTRVVGQPVTLTWTTARAAGCRGSRGVTGDNWSGALAVSGSRAITVNAAGTYTWEITCEGAPPAANAAVSATFTSASSSSSSSGGASSSGGVSSSSGSGGGGGGGSFDVLLLLALTLMMFYGSRRDWVADRRTWSVGNRGDPDEQRLVVRVWLQLQNEDWPQCDN
jgi:hypothetical protein